MEAMITKNEGAFNKYRLENIKKIKGDNTAAENKMRDAYAYTMVYILDRLHFLFTSLIRYMCFFALYF